MRRSALTTLLVLFVLDCAPAQSAARELVKNAVASFDSGNFEEFKKSTYLSIEKRAFKKFMARANNRKVNRVWDERASNFDQRRARAMEAAFREIVADGKQAGFDWGSAVVSRVKVDDDIEAVVASGGKQVLLVLDDCIRTPKKGLLTFDPPIARFPGRTPNTRKMSPQVALEVLDAFEQALAKKWAYYKFRDAGYREAITALRKSVREGADLQRLPVELQKVLCRGVDGHSGVSRLSRPSGFLPFLIEPVGDRYVAFKADRSGFLAPGYPYVTKLDGLDIGRWVEAASALVPNGSPQFVRRNALRDLRYLRYVRGELGVKDRPRVSVELSKSTKRTKKIELPVSNAAFPNYGVWPRGSSRLVKKNIGYLRLSKMDSAAAQHVVEWMQRFRKTDGVIVDVRDNGGGTREALRVLFSYLCTNRDGPRVVNCAAYRKHRDRGEDHLAVRYMHRANYSGWSRQERAAIKSFRKRFKPEWSLPKDDFSEWHYLVLGKLDLDGVYHYDKPVVVLMNSKCFSATDIFLAGLTGWRGVTLLGTPSGGGSARSETVRLGPSGLTLRIASMASFQADGHLFDGRGVEPDLLVEPVPEYFLGQRDNQLERAIEVIRQGRR